MTASDFKRAAIYDYLEQVFPDRKAPSNMIMTNFVAQVQKSISDINMSYGFIAVQTKEYLYNGWIHKTKGAESIGNADVFVPTLKHSPSAMFTNIDPAVNNNEIEEEFVLQDFKPKEGLQIRHFRTNKIIDSLFSTFDDRGGMMSTVNFQVMGKSGTGKTLLMMCMAKDFKDVQPNMNILVVNSEMTEVLMQAYIKKSPVLEGIDLLVMRKYHPDLWAKTFVKAFNLKRWDLIILDSFQDLVVKLQDSLNLNSSKTEAWLVNIMSEMNNRCGTSFFVLNHVNKDGQAAGKSYLKHILDGMMEIERDEHDKTQRFVSFSKNRVGIDSVPLYYEILKEGDTRGFKGEVLWDEERYNRIHEQKQFAERNKAFIEKDLDDFTSAEFFNQEESVDSYD